MIFSEINRVRSDHNLDNTATVLEVWCSAARDVYSSVDCHLSEDIVYDLRYPPSDSDEQYQHAASVQQEALEAARQSGADYLFVSVI